MLRTLIGILPNVVKSIAALDYLGQSRSGGNAVAGKLWGAGSEFQAFRKRIVCCGDVCDDPGPKTSFVGCIRCTPARAGGSGLVVALLPVA